MNRTAISRALAKALAFKEAGQDRRANLWARELVTLLGCEGILAEDAETRPAGRAVDLEGPRL